MDFITQAFADNLAAQQPQGGGWSAIIMLLVFVALIYFLIWRPQSKRAKEQRQLVSSVKPGDEMVTVGGLYGKVKTVDDVHFDVEISPNVIARFQRAALSHILPKGTIK